MDFDTWISVKGDPEYEEGGAHYDKQYPAQGVEWQRWKIELNKPRDWDWGREAQDDLKVKVENVLKENVAGDTDKEKIKEALRLLDVFKSSSHAVGGSIRISMIYDLQNALVS